jgi:hypothetical protein
VSLRGFLGVCECLSEKRREGQLLERFGHLEKSAMRLPRDVEKSPLSCQETFTPAS